MQDMLQALIWVAVGSALGGPARYFVSGLVGRHIGETFPWGTIVVNATGSFVVGLFAAAAATGVFAMTAAWPFAVTGFLGCYTTVSSFSLQTLALARDGEMMQAGANIFISLFSCLVAVALGYAAGVALLGSGAS
jgi:CrcB protein